MEQSGKTESEIMRTLNEVFRNGGGAELLGEGDDGLQFFMKNFIDSVLMLTINAFGERWCKNYDEFGFNIVSQLKQGKRPTRVSAVLEGAKAAAAAAGIATEQIDFVEMIGGSEPDVLVLNVDL
ncbi:hypothetical protein AK812_SmicGene33549 [Symbiodinium microadriaticum]|uniref:Uncharacterized protein n=1 Tax=Symbiodinium microadriaticum TaxID=2951 RepID=A0A1Q9CRE3_SYMMI|nr:hypothetical protein AK812_SmicGene33549 [Symbiodinium microadriaticum]